MLWFIVYVSSAHEDSQHIFVEILKDCFLGSVTEVFLKNIGKKTEYDKTWNVCLNYCGLAMPQSGLSVLLIIGIYSLGRFGEWQLF